MGEVTDETYAMYCMLIVLYRLDVVTFEMVLTTIERSQILNP